MNKEPIRHSTPATIEPSVWRAGVKLPRYPFRLAPRLSMLGNEFGCLVSAGVICLGASLLGFISFWVAMALGLTGTAFILLALGDRANTLTAPLSLYGLNPYATHRVPCMVRLTVEGFELWRDMGVVGFDDVRLVYSGLCTSFALRPENMFGADPSGLWIKGFRQIRLRVPGSAKVVLEFRPFERFIEGDSENRKSLCTDVVRRARDNSISRPAVSGPVQWPPLDMSLRDLARAREAYRRWCVFALAVIIPSALFLMARGKWEGAIVGPFGIAMSVSAFVHHRKELEAYFKAREEADDPASLPGKV